jgi:hypothetical protein
VAPCFPLITATVSSLIKDCKATNLLSLIQSAAEVIDMMARAAITMETPSPSPLHPRAIPPVRAENMAAPPTNHQVLS